MSYLARRNLPEGADATHPSSDELRIVSLPRLLCGDDFELPHDVDILEDRWLADELRNVGLKESSLVRGKRPGGVIVGEGDTGKTWFTDRLESLSTDKYRVRIFRLREYVGDAVGLRDDVNAFVEETTCCRTRTVVLDGLDENPESAGMILRLCRAHLRKGGTVRFWITSRQIKEVDLLVGRDSLLKIHRLVPFLRHDIRSLAEGAGLDGKAFVRKLDLLGLTALASKPGGAVLLLLLFRKGRLSEELKVLLNDIVESFAEARRDGRKIPEAETKVSELRILDAAAWTATMLLFNERNSIWDGEPTECPSGALPFRELERGDYSFDILSELLKRRLFEPLARNHYRFVSDEMLVPYLTAKWLYDKGNRRVANLFETRFGIGSALRSVLAWLARFDPEQTCGWIPHAPQCFLGCHEAIDAYGADRFYEAMKVDFLRQSWRDRLAFCATAGVTMPHLEELGACALERLGSPRASIAEVCLAATLAARTNDIRGVVDGLVEVFVTRTLDDEDRRRILQVLDWVLPQKAYLTSLARLKPFLLSRDKADRDRDGALGCYLSLLGEILSAEELTGCIVKPWHWDCDRRLQRYLSGGPGQLNVEDIPYRHVVTYLRWAAEALRSWRRDATLRTVAMRVFAHAWKWTHVGSVAAAAADYADAAISVLQPYDVTIFPVLYADDDIRLGDGELSLNAWIGDRPRRFNVLRAWLARRDHVGKDALLYIVSLTRQRAALVYADEFDALREACNGWKDDQGENAALDQLLSCLDRLQDAECRKTLQDFEGRLFHLGRHCWLDSSLDEDTEEDDGPTSDAPEADDMEMSDDALPHLIADLRGDDPDKAIAAFEAVVREDSMSAAVTREDIVRTAKMYLWMRRRHATAFVACDSDLDGRYSEDACHQAFDTIVKRLIGEPSVKALNVLREELKAHPDDAELKDLCLTVERRLVEQLPPKLVHPEILDAWAGVKGVVVPAGKRVRGRKYTVQKSEQLQALVKHMDRKMKNKDWGAKDVERKDVDNLWRANKVAWDAWAADGIGYKNVDCLQRGLEHYYDKRTLRQDRVRRT